MIKPIRALGAALLLLTLCAACSASQPEPAAYDPAATSKALLDSGAFAQALESLDADMIVPLYGLTVEPEEAAAYASLEGGYEQFAVLRMADENAAKTALDTLKSYISAQQETEADVQYKPEDLPKLENAMARQAGATVLLVVAEDYGKVETALSGT